MKKQLSFLFLLSLCFSATIALAQLPAGYVSIYELKGEAERAPIAVGAGATYQILGPGADWNLVSDWDFSKYRKLVINLAFDPADAGRQIAVRFNTNGPDVRREMFTLPTEGTTYSAEIDLTKYAVDGKVGVGGMMYYNGSSHWSFTYDGTPAANAVTINYVAVGDEIIDYTIIPDGYISIYELKGEEERAPIAVGAGATYQILGPGADWNLVTDWDFSNYRKLVINLTFDPADAGRQIAVRFNTNGPDVRREMFTLPIEGTNYSAEIDLTKYAVDGKVGVGGMMYYNGSSHWSFTYDGTPAANAVTINYVAVGDEILEFVPTMLLVDKLLDGSITDDEDYKVVAYLSWDIDNVYINLEINDDVLFDGAANVYENDNIEIYFDMDNSKNPLWPRNAGWPNSSFGTNDYQFRILPGKDWEDYNDLADVELTTTMKDGGYDISVIIPWSSLMEGFVPEAGIQIGFDILASDNDDDYRTQVSWYSNSLMLWNDASYWGTLELVEGGTFKSIPDVTAPEEPVITATVDQARVTLTWDRPSDNVAVLSYQVKQNDEVIREKIYAKESGESLIINNLEDGTYTFTVIVYDNSGNTSSADVEVVINTTSVVELEVAFKAYPNPSYGIVNIESGSNTASVLNVFNMTGQKVLSKTFVNNCSIDLSHLSKGIYILNVLTDNKVHTTKIDIK